MSAELKVVIGGDASELKRALSGASAMLSKFEAKANKIADAGQKIAGLGATLTATLTLPIVGLGSAAIKAYGDIEALQLGLEAVTGSAEQASAQFTRLKEVAKLPGLGLEEAVRGAINLQSIGIQAGQAENILMQFGNAVATVGKGRAEFERAIYGVQQLANTDFPLGEDLNIIKDALPQVTTLLKEAFGSARSDELAKMGVSSKQIVDVITKGLSELPRVTGGVKGAFENLQDSVRISLSKIGRVINENLNISDVVDKITRGIDRLVSGFESLNPVVQKIIIGVGVFAAAFGPLLVAFGSFAAILPGIIAGIDAMGTAIGAILSPVGLLVAGILAIVGAVIYNWDKIKPYLVDTINYFIDLYNESLVVRGAVKGIAIIFKSVFFIVKGILNVAWENLKTFGKLLIDEFKAIGKVIKGVLTLDVDDLKSGISDFYNAFSKGFKGALNNVKNQFEDTSEQVQKSISEIYNAGKLEHISSSSGKAITAVEVKAPDLTSVENDVIKGLNGVKEKAERNVKANPIEIPAALKLNGEAILSSSKAMFEQIESIGERMAMSVKYALIPAAKEINVFMVEWGQKLNEDFSQLVSSSISGGISDMFSNIGNAIAQGGSVLSATGNALKSLFAGFLSDMGKMLIKYGTLAVLKGTLDQAIKFGGVSSITAGFAAIAVGALLTTAGSAIGSRASQGFQGGSYASTSVTGYSGYNAPQSHSQLADNKTNQKVEFEIKGKNLVGVLDNTITRNNRING